MRIDQKVKVKLSIAGSAFLIAITLTGCAGHTHSLVHNESDAYISGGTFKHGGSEGTLMVLEFLGTRFEAEGFNIVRRQNLAELRQHFGAGKHYDRIFSGLDTDHYLYSAQAKLHSSSGATLECSAAWKAGGTPAGNCVTADGAHIDFRYR